MRQDVRRALLPMEEAVRQGMPFEERLKMDPLVKAEQETLRPPPTATRAVAEIGEPRGSWRKPATWQHVADSPDLLLAHHDGWRRVSYDETRPGLVCLDGTWLEDVKLPSLHIPDEGKREARHG